MHNSENKPVVDKPVLHNPAEDQRTLDNVIAGYGSPLWRNREKVLTVFVYYCRAVVGICPSRPCSDCPR